MSVIRIETLKVFELEPRRKHPVIFEWFDQLAPGQSFIIENDHDPIPLFYELQAERKGQLGAFEYLQKGPEAWKVQITKNITGSAMPANDSERDPEQVKVLDVTTLAPPQKHPTVFQWFEDLKPGESFTLKNDHDPKPLYYQMLGVLGQVFNWEYLQQGPDWWHVSIQKKQADEPNIGEIAAKDSRKAEAMKKMGIDFCCGGHKTLDEAATEAGIKPEDLINALNDAEKKAPAFNNSFDKWDVDFLADYIYNQHHKYYYDVREQLLELSAKVKQVHAAGHPELIELDSLVNKLFAELNNHFYKEERVLFPYIKECAISKKSGIPPSTRLSLSQGPLAMMLMEHEAAGDLLKEIRGVTNDYRTPSDACNSYRHLYTMLEELEADLHQHIHLENNILFPKARLLEKELVG